MDEMATEHDYREALYEAQRALMHAGKALEADDEVRAIVYYALDVVTEVLDIGRDEAHEQIAT